MAETLDLKTIIEAQREYQFHHPMKTLKGMKVVRVEPRFLPALRLRDDFEWCTDAFRAEMNHWLLETFGTVDESVVKRGQALMFRQWNTILMREEDAALLRIVTT